jgi:hypothetical protein
MRDQGNETRCIAACTRIDVFLHFLGEIDFFFAFFAWKDLPIVLIAPRSMPHVQKPDRH